MAFPVTHCLCFLACVTLTLGQQNIKDDFKEYGVYLHNEYRSLHGGPDIAGDTKLHEAAQNLVDLAAENGMSVLEDVNDWRVGVNFYQGYFEDDAKFEAIKYAVQSWYNQMYNYDFSNPGFSPGTASFSQLVWKGSGKLGVGVSSTLDEDGNFLITVVCLYDPRGNVNGQYAENVVEPLEERRVH